MEKTVDVEISQANAIVKTVVTGTVREQLGLSYFAEDVRSRSRLDEGAIETNYLSRVHSSRQVVYVAMLPRKEIIVYNGSSRASGEALGGKAAYGTRVLSEARR